MPAWAAPAADPEAPAPVLADPTLVNPVPEPPVAPEPALPDAVRAMLDAAIAGGKEAEVDTVARLAKSTNPEAAKEVDLIVADFRAERSKAKEAEATAARERLARAKIWQNWKGEGQIGGSLSSGNTRSAGLSAGLSLTRKGIDWTYKARAQADYQRTNGRTAIERYLVELEPQHRINGRAFAYGLGRWESDRMQGFDERWNVSGGLGYKLIDGKAMSLSLKGGPAWRLTEFIRGGSDGELTGLAGLDFGWQLSPTLRLTQTASTIVGEENSATSSLTSLNAKINSSLSARIAYAAQINSAPPPGIESVDTQTRFTLVYGF
ncbi:MAG TPA: DUF481 domain-containing protein [Sphingopyxis sp.]|nr:DUF481 domain-containing protein [Sphingopyxis sp.]HMP46467.1 DUF481 domain-containing protein [Sphingopyxis sp.]HMQ18057.1 DUF481 domain-containing protein [Sphingopyxis sp.]